MQTDERCCLSGPSKLKSVRLLLDSLTRTHKHTHFQQTRRWKATTRGQTHCRSARIERETRIKISLSSFSPYLLCLASNEKLASPQAGWSTRLLFFFFLLFPTMLFPCWPPVVACSLIIMGTHTQFACCFLLAPESLKSPLASLLIPSSYFHLPLVLL